MFGVERTGPGRSEVGAETPCPAERMAHMFVRRVSTSSSKLRSVTSCWVSGSSAIRESQSKKEQPNGPRISCGDSDCMPLLGSALRLAHYCDRSHGPVPLGNVR